jgi:hypothetical protein
MPAPRRNAASRSAARSQRGQGTHSTGRTNRAAACGSAKRVPKLASSRSGQAFAKYPGE